MQPTQKVDVTLLQREGRFMTSTVQYSTYFYECVYSLQYRQYCTFATHVTVGSHPFGSGLFRQAPALAAPRSHSSLTATGLVIRSELACGGVLCTVQYIQYSTDSTSYIVQFCQYNVVRCTVHIPATVLYFSNGHFTFTFTCQTQPRRRSHHGIPIRIKGDANLPGTELGDQAMRAYHRPQIPGSRDVTSRSTSQSPANESWPGQGDGPATRLFSVGNSWAFGWGRATFS